MRTLVIKSWLQIAITLLQNYSVFSRFLSQGVGYRCRLRIVAIFTIDLYNRYSVTFILYRTRLRSAVSRRFVYFADCIKNRNITDEI
jgi:hypothetical protein